MSEEPDRLYVTSDDDGNIVRTVDIRDDGKVDVYDATDGNYDNGHGHEVYSSMDEFLDDQLASSADEGNGGDVYSRSADDEDSQDRDWDDRN